MNIITIARRASMGRTLRNHFDEATKKLEIGKKYYQKIPRLISLSQNEIEFHGANYLTSIVSTLEALISDIAVEFLICYPGHLENKSISLELLTKSGSTSNLIQNSAEDFINKLTYDQFSVSTEKIAKLFNKEAQLDEDLLESISEIKASRDIYIHAGGRVNKLYFNKARSKARDIKIDKKLPLDDKYLMQATVTIETMVQVFHELIPKILFNYGRVSTFKDMWNASHLAKCLEFEAGWLIKNENTLEPKAIINERYWSNSEKMLLDFFIGIYNTKHPWIKHGLMEILQRWPTDRIEGRIINSWIDSPFWF